MAEAFTSPGILASRVAVPTGTLIAPLRAASAAQTEAERLLQKARELREAATTEEDELHSTMLQKKKARDDATDLIIDQLFPTEENDGVCALCERLRQKRLASDMLVVVVERLHEREMNARGLEHVEPSVQNDQTVTFKRVAEPNEAELNKVQGVVDRLIEAAEVLDKEFIEEKSQCEGVIVSIEMAVSILNFV